MENNEGTVEVEEGSLKYNKPLDDADPTDPIENKKRKGSCVLNYSELTYCWRKGTRNGNLRRLGAIEIAFYKAAMWYARIKSKIINNKIIAQLRRIVEKLENTIKKKIMRVGRERAKGILTEFEENGVFDWAPQLRTWLRDTKYVFWLGLDSQPSSIRLSI